MTQPLPAGSVPLPDNLAPIPTNATLLQVNGQDGSKWLMYQFSTPQGVNAFWFDEVTIPKFIGMQQQAYKELKSGLVLPANSPLVLPNA